MLSEEADLEVEIGALVRFSLHAVLTDQHERGKEEGLDGGFHSENDKGLIPLGDTRDPTEIGADPEPVHDEVDVDEQHAAREAGDRIGDLLLGRGLCLFALPALRQSLDIALQHGTEPRRAGQANGSSTATSRITPRTTT